MGFKFEKAIIMPPKLSAKLLARRRVYMINFTSLCHFFLLFFNFLYSNLAYFSVRTYQTKS